MVPLYLWNSCNWHLTRLLNFALTFQEQKKIVNNILLHRLHPKIFTLQFELQIFNYNKILLTKILVFNDNEKLWAFLSRIRAAGNTSALKFKSLKENSRVTHEIVINMLQFLYVTRGTRPAICFKRLFRFEPTNK